jgi:hypothetical protein
VSINSVLYSVRTGETREEAQETGLLAHSRIGRHMSVPWHLESVPLMLLDKSGGEQLLSMHGRPAVQNLPVG